MGAQVSIIIPSFNAREHLGDCIKALSSFGAGLVREVLVVDNASTDGSADMVEREFPQVRLIRNTENRGFAAANNQAFKAAQGRYLLLLNSDAFVKDGCIETLVNFMELNPDAAAAGPMVLNPDGTLQNKGYFFPSVAFSLLVLSGINRFLPEIQKRRLFPRFYWDEHETRQVDYIEGSCFLLRRSALDKVGLLPEEYFLYFEEEEWCFRARSKGYGIWYVPAAEVVHVSSASGLPGKEKIFERSRLLFYRRNIGRVWGAAICLIMILATSIDYIRARVGANSVAELSAIRSSLKRHLDLLSGLTVSRKR